MTPEDLEHQAEQFGQYHRRHGGTLDEDFSGWAFTKQFVPEDRRCIYGIVRQEALASTECVVTDLTEWNTAAETVDGESATDYLLS